MTPILQLQHLQTGYSERTGRTILSQDLHLNLYASEVTMLMGKNGSGKSTLLHTIAGLLPPLRGQVLLSGKDLAQLSLHEQALQMSLVLTERLQSGQMTVREVVQLGRAPHTNFFGTLRSRDHELVAYCLERCGLTTLASRPFVRLSDGEKQRALIARALAQETPLILLDEPTAHLDLSARLEVILMLRELAHELGKGILVSTHELELALSWADKLWLMDSSGAITEGAPEDLALAGHLERVFGSERLSYDLEEGRFLVRQGQGAGIYLTGEGLYAQWIARALRRSGYLPLATPQPELPTLICTASHWQLTLPYGARYEGDTIAELLSLLPKG